MEQRFHSINKVEFLLRHIHLNILVLELILVTSLPSRGGVAIQENEVDNRNGGLVIYTSTDQGGNFRIGEGVVIDQITGTISGNFYSKSLFANVTPLILALGGE